MFGDYTKEFKRNLQLAYPVMLGQLGHVSVGLIDNLMIGRLGATELAAVSAANSIFFIILIFGIGLSTAITPLVAKADGENDTSRIGRILTHGLIMNTVLSVLMYLLIMFAKPVLYMLDQPVEVIDLAIPYLEIITLSFIPLMIFQAFRQFTEGLSYTKPAMYASLIGNFINIVVNYAFIFGKFGAPQLGLIGAGIGTFVSRIAMLAVIIYFGRRKKKVRDSFETFSFKNLDNKIFKRLFQIGFPTALQMVFEVGAFASAVFIAGLISTESIAANQIGQSLTSVGFMLATGLASAATIRVGNQLGLRNYKLLKDVAISNILLVLVLMTIFGILFITTKDILPTIYIDDVEVVSLTASILGLAALFQLSDGVQVVSLGALRGLQDVKVPTFVTFVAYWVIALPLSYIFAIELEFGVKGIWMGLGLGLTFSAVLNFYRFYKISNELIANAEKA